MPRKPDPELATWSIDRLRAANSAYVHGDAETRALPEVKLGYREYQRRRSAARWRGEVWPPLPASAPVLPPLGNRRPGDPSWSDEELRAARRAVEGGGCTDPAVVARYRMYKRLIDRRCLARKRAGREVAQLHAPSRALLADLREMADHGETLPGAAARLGRTERGLSRALHRFGDPGHAVHALLTANAGGSGRVRQGTIYGRRAS